MADPLALAVPFAALLDGASRLIKLLLDTRRSSPHIDSLVDEIRVVTSALEGILGKIQASSNTLSSTVISDLLEISESLQQEFRSLGERLGFMAFLNRYEILDQYRTRIKTARAKLNLIDGYVEKSSGNRDDLEVRLTRPKRTISL